MLRALTTAALLCAAQATVYDEIHKAAARALLGDHAASSAGGCFSHYVGDGVCDAACAGSRHGHDGGDCTASPRFRATRAGVVDAFSDSGDAFDSDKMPHSDGRDAFANNDDARDVAPGRQPGSAAPNLVGEGDHAVTLTKRARKAHHVGPYYRRQYTEKRGDALVVRRGLKFALRLLNDKAAAGAALTALKVGSYTLAATLRKGDAKDPVYDVAMLPSNATVGRLAVKGVRADASEVDLGSALVLFNPLDAAGGCHLTNASHVQEYVAQETGRYYFGDVTSGGAVAGVNSGSWAYHQYDPHVTEAMVYLLKFLPEEKRGNPIFVSRHFSTVLAAGWTPEPMPVGEDGTMERPEGVLWGRWDGEYDDGKPPGHWKGSREIFALWAESKRKSVQYGQCWVFAAIFTTALRSLGLPARSVTNFRSGHDTKDAQGKFDSVILSDAGGLGSESIWNFHVWTETWLQRADLDAKKKPVGWNAVDATPQELSGDSGIYAMGPAYVAAREKR